MATIAADAHAIQSWLDGSINHERSGTFRAIKLERIATFLRRLPSPPEPLTIAGTKGKGSVARLAEAALIAHGAPTVAFTSPHVSSVLERWRIDGAVASAAAIAERCEQVAALERGGEPLTYFERTFAVACLLAADRPGTSFICEVGLGGRLDCANALDCAVAVVTHLSHDHRDVLGPTLAHIAREKLAIARPGRPLVIAPQSAEAEQAIVSQLPLVGAMPEWVRPDPGTRFVLALPGEHQQANVATAFAAARLYRPRLDEFTARRGMAEAGLAARCQLVTWRGRRLLVDGAHNGPSVAATMAVAGTDLRPGWSLILGLANDKEVDEVLAAIPPGIEVRRCGYRSIRARGSEAWPPLALRFPWHADIASALASTPPDQDVCISGSFYLAGEALALIGETGIPG